MEALSEEIEEINVVELNGIRDALENMSKFNQVEVLRILSRHKEVALNENKYGIHINLSELKREIIDDLKKYIGYVNAQEIELNHLEQQKETFKNIYFTKDNKDILGKTNSSK
jgi:uncharacterized protein (DUF342 family)